MLNKKRRCFEERCLLASTDFQSREKITMELNGSQKLGVLKIFSVFNRRHK